MRQQAKGRSKEKPKKVKAIAVTIKTAREEKGERMTEEEKLILREEFHRRKSSQS